MYGETFYGRHTAQHQLKFIRKRPYLKGYYFSLNETNISCGRQNVSASHETAMWQSPSVWSQNRMGIFDNWAASWQNQQNGMCAQRRLRSAWASVAVRMMKHWTLNYILSAQWKLWSVWADAQADLSLRWAHMSFCWFCHEVAQLVNKTMEPPALSLRTLNSC